MQLKTNQQQLIDATQQLIGWAIDNQQFDLAIGIGGLLKSLTSSYKDITDTLSTVTLPPSNDGKLRGLLGSPSIGSQQYVSQQQAPKSLPPKPSSYVWGDGFQGVTVPKSQPQDYWEEESV